MADLARSVPVARTWAPVAWAAAGALLAAAALRALEPTVLPGVTNFAIVFGSLLIEAVPFILLGAVVSALLEVFLPARALERLTSLPNALQLPACGLAGFAFPVCECGSVPVARRLVAKGLAPSSAVTFMLAAPVVNPVVIASTVVAYRGRAAFWPMVAGRTVLGLVVAIAVGWAVGHQNAGDLLRRRDGADFADHAHDGRLQALFDHVSADFLFMGRYLVIGAAFAATLQTFVPQSVVASLADAPVLNLVAMMGLAFVLSLCSESDAFVAASFVQFGVASQLAFLVFGPMVDTKLAVLYSGTFGRELLRTVVVVAAATTLAGTLWMEVAFG
jgi:uncharacterized membrane protein YraQ (UPF0718 family)